MRVIEKDACCLTGKLCSNVTIFSKIACAVPGESAVLDYTKSDGKFSINK